MNEKKVIMKMTLRSEGMKKVIIIYGENYYKESPSLNPGGPPSTHFMVD
jgi:hypothetical protein